MLLHPKEVFNHDKEFKKYLEKFKPEKIQVIQCAGEDIGRLRMVRSQESIYIGGVQILSRFQGKGIGTAIFTDIIAESKLCGICVTLEVYNINNRAISFYKNLGFKETGEIDGRISMEYVPN